MHPIRAIDKLFYAVFGQTKNYDLMVITPAENHPEWTRNLFKIVFGSYMLVTVVVLVKLLIATMSDTYQQIQAKSDMEWKFGLSKLIRSIHRATTAPSPINLITSWFFYFKDLFVERVIKHPIEVFDQLFFAVFGQTSSDQLQAKTDKKSVWVDTLFRLAFGVYMLVSVIVLMNLLIAMMTDTYVRIQAQSDIEWKFGLSKLVRNMHRTTSAPSPFNLVSTWSLVLIDFCRAKVKTNDRPNLIRMVNTLQDKHLSPRSRAAAKWLSKINKKSKIVPQQEVIQKPVHVPSATGSHMDFVQHTTRIDFVTEWDVVAKKYRNLTRYTENEENEKEEKKA